jgi:hypothetical protein
MEKIIMVRGYGKTTQLIKKSAQNGDYIVCYNTDEALYIQHMAKNMGLDIPLPVTYREFLNKEYSDNIKGFLFDNVDEFLQSISKVPIKTITMNP